MERSEQINEIMGALAKAQGAYGAATKDRENPHFKSSYATLASGWNAARAALSANGLAVVQSVQTEQEGVEVETLLGHAGGQWLTSKLFVPATKFDAQGLGSASTYARRYALFAMLGIAPEDDDGEDASRSMGDKAHEPPQRQPRAQSQRSSETACFPNFGKHKNKPITDVSVTVKDLETLASDLLRGINNPEKARFRAQNEALRAAVCAEIDRRTTVPVDNTDTNADWGMGSAAEAEAEAMASAHD